MDDVVGFVKRPDFHFLLKVGDDSEPYRSIFRDALTHGDDRTLNFILSHKKFAKAFINSCNIPGLLLALVLKYYNKTLQTLHTGIKQYSFK